MTKLIICQHCGQETPTDPDGRATNWRVRIRLYGPQSATEPEADTDPDLPPDKAGTAVVHGLPGVAEFLRDVATPAHAPSHLSGLEPDTLRHRLKSLRPTLSRRGGNATWRVPYQVDFKDWMARVDVEKVT